MSFPAPLAAWHQRGDRARVFGQEVFFVDSGGSGPVLLLIHGFPTCSFDFHRVFDRLAESFRVIAHDHLGFGLSDKPSDYSYSLVEQAEVAIELWRLLEVRSGHLVAHDYGTSVATELLARRERGLLPTEYASVTLCNGSVHLDLAHLTVSQRLLRSPRIGPWFARAVGEGFMKRRLRGLLGDRSSVSAEDLSVIWEALNLADGRDRLPTISSYLDERVRFARRWIGALERLDLPAHVLWGRRDPIAVPAIAEALASEIPGARLTWLDELGHFPMLEDPARWAECVLAFVDGLSAG